RGKRSLYSTFRSTVMPRGLPRVSVHCSFFPTKARYSGVALSNNLAQGIFGGFQPFIAMFLIQKTGLPYTAGLYLIIISLSFLIIFLLYSRSKSVVPES
ncbi:MAG: hypothetical protein K2W94_09185, partial [Alphaproteobacteria bacterium]|nr:hypothetical protein [Alphaproteobacteria bacterium]